MVSGLWLLHPLQTASVTYIVQRAESLMGCFYLLTLYSFARGVESNRPLGWFVCSWFACLLGMATKEVMVSAPVIVAFYDRMFVSPSWREVWRRRKLVHVALAGTWLLLAWLISGTGARGGSAGFSLGIGWWTYWVTQFHAVTKYLALAVWPHPLVVDYGVQWARGAGDVVPYAIGVVALLVLTAVACIRGRVVGFLGIWFFALLAPTSVMPGGRQTMADHRMYLPLAAVMAFIVLEAHRHIGRRALVGGAMVLALFGALSIRRNFDYRSTLSIWADTVAKRPANRWARDNLGNALLEVGHASDALPHYEAALALAPNDPVHHYNAGNALLRLDRVADAIAQFTEAVRLDGNYLPARTNLGNALCRVGRFDEAITHYAVVVRGAPDRAEHHANLADALFHARRIDDAVAEFRAASQLQPDNPEFAYALGCILLQTGRLTEAVTEFQRVLRINPAHAEAHNNLGSSFAQLGRVDDALRHVREAVRLNPQNAEAHNNLGAIYLHLGRRDEAIAEFTETLRLRPDHAMARENLERLRPSAPLR
jgi:tetratricopeptide (TPR) repeat protein